MEAAGQARVAKADLGKLVRRSQRETPEQLARQYGLAFPEAETLNVALLIHQALLYATRAREMIVSQVSMRDGLLLDLARSVTGGEDPALWEGVLGSALAVAEKYHVDLRPQPERGGAGGVALRPTPGRARPETAAPAALAGGGPGARGRRVRQQPVAPQAQLLPAGELARSSAWREETLTVALLARYHRRSMPKAAHPEYMAMPREVRMVVNKLAALLRLADALDRGHAQQVRQVRCERREDELVIVTPGVTDLALERRAAAAKSDLFEEIYGLKVRLEEEPMNRAAGGAAAP